MYLPRLVGIGSLTVSCRPSGTQYWHILFHTSIFVQPLSCSYLYIITFLALSYGRIVLDGRQLTLVGYCHQWGGRSSDVDGGVAVVSVTIRRDLWLIKPCIVFGHRQLWRYPAANSLLCGSVMLWLLATANCSRLRWQNSVCDKWDGH